MGGKSGGGGKSWQQLVAEEAAKQKRDEPRPLYREPGGGPYGDGKDQYGQPLPNLGDWRPPGSQQQQGKGMYGNGNPQGKGMGQQQADFANVYSQGLQNSQGTGTSPGEMVGGQQIGGGQGKGAQGATTPPAYTTPAPTEVPVAPVTAPTTPVAPPAADGTVPWYKEND